MRPLFLLFILLFQGHLLSVHPCLRTLIVANTEDEGIGCARDVVTMKKNLAVIGKKIGFSVSTKVIRGKHFSTSSVVRELKRLPRTSEDILFFYYTGHGFNDYHSSSRWPTLCTFLQPPSSSLAGRAVMKYLKQQRGRLKIALFDCCNAPSSYKRIVSHIRTFALPLNGNEKLPGLKPLFLKTQGLVVGAGASVGEYGYATEEEGGFFTIGFIKALKARCTGTTSWSEIFQTTSAYTNTETFGAQHCIYTQTS